MRQRFAEWLWRLALLATLAWIGWELHRFHDDMLQPLDDTVTATAPAEDDAQASLEQLRDALASLNEKVDAILVVMARAR
jgi:hypothetical protein